jgi:hypothetical protein
MTKQERRQYLLDHGWHRVGTCWQPPDQPYALYSLAAAIRTALSK